MSKFHILPIISAFIICSCNNQSAEDHFHPAYNHLDSCNEKDFVYDNFEIQELPFNERPYDTTNKSVKPPPLMDDNNITLHFYNEKLDYHPVAMAEYAISLLDVYQRLGDTNNLHLAVEHANKLLGISLPIDSALLFPYTFNYRFFGKDNMVSPWFSAIAQGKILSLFSRLYFLTLDKKYLETAHKIFKSFYRFKGTHPDWISCVDKKGNIWLEEYPFEQPSHVLNGMVFAIFGIYDYYIINKTKESETLLRASITTIRKNIHLYRDENKISYYSLKYDVKNPHYHPVHIKQLFMLYKISAIEDFNEMAKKLQNDEKTMSDTTVTR